MAVDRRDRARSHLRPLFRRHRLHAADGRPHLDKTRRRQQVQLRPKHRRPDPRAWRPPITRPGAAAYGLTAGSEGGDLDGDGLTNFQEYAFGLIPNSGASVNPITAQLDKSTGQFKYTRRATPVTTGVGYTYESSTTLSGTWSGFTPVSAVSNNATPVEEITVTVPPGLLTEPKLFIRVRAEQP